MLDQQPIPFADALAILAAAEGRNAMVLISEQDAKVSSVLVTFRGEVGKLDMRDRPLMDDSDTAGVAVLTVGGITIEIAAQHTASVSTSGLISGLVFELHGVTLEFRGIHTT